jgi:hypothetical protein
MAQVPKCKMCGKKHWGVCGRIWTEEPMWDSETAEGVYASGASGDGDGGGGGDESGSTELGEEVETPMQRWRRKNRERLREYNRAYRARKRREALDGESGVE